MTISPLAFTRRLRKAERELSEIDTSMGDLIKRYGKCTISPFQRDPCAALIRSIISQQLSVKAASTIIGRVEAKLGRKKLSAKNIRNLSFDELRECGLSGAKVNYSHGIAQATLDKSIIFEELYDKNTEQVIAELTALKGVGEWTAQMFCIFSLGHLDVLATGDVGLQRGLQQLHGLEQKPDPQQMYTLTEKWQPYRSIASWYLWRLADDS